MELIEALACAAAGGVCGMLLMGVLTNASKGSIAKEYFDIGKRIGERQGFEKGYTEAWKEAKQEAKDVLQHVREGEKDG